MNKRHYEHTLPNIRGSLSNTYGSATENVEKERKFTQKRISNYFLLLKITIMATIAKKAPMSKRDAAPFETPEPCGMGTRQGKY